MGLDNYFVWLEVGGVKFCWNWTEKLEFWNLIRLGKNEVRKGTKRLENLMYLYINI